MDKVRTFLGWLMGSFALNIAANISTGPIEDHWSAAGKFLDRDWLPFVSFAVLLVVWAGLSLYFERASITSMPRTLFRKKQHKLSAPLPPTPPPNPLDAIWSADLLIAKQPCGVKWKAKLERNWATGDPYNQKNSKRHLVKVEGPLCANCGNELVAQEPRMPMPLYTLPTLLNRKLQDDDGGTAMEVAFCPACPRHYVLPSQLGDCRAEVRTDLEKRLGLRE